MQTSAFAGSVIRQFGHSGRHLSIAGGGLAVSAAAYAFFDAGLGDAVAADPLPIQRLVEAYDSVTEGQAGRTIPVTSES